jgi:hypothetical protein
MPHPERRLAVLFDEAAWAEDLARSTDAGRQAATMARAEYKRDGIPLVALRRCEREARVVGRGQRTVQLEDGADLFSWAREQWPEPRWTVELDPWQLSPNRIR